MGGHTCPRARTHSPQSCQLSARERFRVKLDSNFYHTPRPALLSARSAHTSAPKLRLQKTHWNHPELLESVCQSHIIYIYIYMFTKTNIYKSQWLLWISEALLHRARWRSALNASSTKTCFKRTAFCWALFFNPRTVYTGRLYLCERRERHLSEQDAQTLCASYKSREHLLDLEHVWC